MRENEDFVYVIKWVRNVIEKYETETSIKAYSRGYPFTYWQQYITLRFWLFIALACVILAVFLVLSIVLVNIWSAAIMVNLLIFITPHQHNTSRLSVSSSFASFVAVYYCRFVAFNKLYW